MIRHLFPPVEPGNSGHNAARTQLPHGAFRTAASRALSSHDPDQVANEARPRQALMSATILTPRNNDRMKSGETPSRFTPAAAFHGASGDCSGP
jgi:hypothetical protein